jgi:hypothetical protein
MELSGKGRLPIAHSRQSTGKVYVAALTPELSGAMKSAPGRV